jgi:thiol-disulfide isomerase/thioredoxin
VTDVDGYLHHLYANYLNIGKTVVLEIFNTTCSPCNSIAPLLQPLYEDWGGGDADVEFFALTDKPADSNPVIFNYLIDHNLTFPGVSTSGGSITAATPYENGPSDLSQGFQLLLSFLRMEQSIIMCMVLMTRQR